MTLTFIINKHIKFRILMNSSMNNQLFLDNEQKFSSCINKITMKFKNPKIENSYQKSRHKHKNIFIMIGLCIIGNIFVMSLRVIQVFLILLFQVDQTIKTTFFTLILSVILLLSGNLFEAIIYFTNKMKVLKGFFIVILIIISGISSSIDNSLTSCDSRIPLFVPVFVFGIISIILVAFHYSDNWICGSLQILILMGGIDYYIIISPFSWFQDKSFLLIISIMTCISLLVTIYYYEYFHRKLTFRRVISKIQKKTLEEIIAKLPEPILLTQKGNINWANNAFYEIGKKPNSALENIVNENPDSVRSMRENIGHDFLDYSKKILNSLVSKTGEKTLAEKIEQNCRISKEQFLYQIDNKRKKYFEVSSSLFKVQSQLHFNLYLLKDLTFYEKVKGLKSKKKVSKNLFCLCDS